jgi:3-hydroxybutyryl-CoA dehydrogenase
VELEHVLVVGAGQMGGGIAQVVAASGRRVSLYDAAPGAVERGIGAMRKSLERLAEKGAPTPTRCSLACSRWTTSSRLT